MPVYKPESEGHLNGLAKQFEKNENCTALRRNALKTGKVCCWPSAKQTGVMSLPNVSLNAEAMKAIISIWCPQSETPKTIPLEDAKHQARKTCFFLSLCHPFWGCCSTAPLLLPTEVLRFRKKMQMNTAVSKVHVDAAALRGLFTIMLRRHDGSKRRVPQINGFSFNVSRGRLFPTRFRFSFHAGLLYSFVLLTLIPSSGLCSARVVRLSFDVLGPQT